MEKFESLKLLLDQFESLKVLIGQMFQEEKGIEDSYLTKKGFVIHRYKLKNIKPSREPFDKLRKEFLELVNLESKLQKQINQSMPLLIDTEDSYDRYFKVNHGFQVRLISQYFNNMISNTKNGVARIEQIMKILSESEKVQIIETENQQKLIYLLLSLNKMTSQILKFSQFIQQMYDKATKFKGEILLEEARVYGRAMTKREFKKTLGNKRLSSSKNPTPVFDCPESTRRKVLNLSKDERKEFFGRIGVENASNIVIFETRLRPVNWGTPIPQTNGLKEYKFPNGIKIDLLQAA
ncbi:MAG: hypothetical protein AABX04_05365 [Nanoarchaeota archaeon]